MESIQQNGHSQLARLLYLRSVSGGFTMKVHKNLTHEEEVAQCEQDFHDHHLTTRENLEKILFETIDALETSKVSYALIGGVAVKSMGRPRITHDIDIFVKPDDAVKTLNVLKSQGFTTQRRDPYWLFKAWKGEILVDIIFKSSGDIYFDEEVESHVRRMTYLGRPLNAISPEDFLVIKAAAHEEHIPHHWHDALAVLKQGNIDWEYLLKRAKNAPRRVLSLLIYGQSNDIAVPNEVIKKLYKSVFDSPIYFSEFHLYPYRLNQRSESQNQTDHHSDSPIYIKGRIIEALGHDERVAEHDIKVIVAENAIIARGEVFNQDQKNAIEEVITSIAPSHEFKNQVAVIVLESPQGSEVII
jgi:predicted nucleotidyltransferase